MLTLMDRLNYIFWSFAFICICGGIEDLSDSCEAVLRVRRGTTWRVAPQQSLTVSCPVKHCGETLHISWCKIFGITCEQINGSTENVEIRQIHTEDEEISQLSFKQVSTDDDGLYRCELTGQTRESVSHSINISVSDMNVGIVNSNDAAAAEPQTPAGDQTGTWPLYFSIYASIILLIVSTVFGLLCFCPVSLSCIRIWTDDSAKSEDMSPMSPVFPKWRNPVAPEQHSSVLTDVYYTSNGKTPTSSSSPPFTRNQPAEANTGDQTQNSTIAVYAVIKQRQRGSPARKQETTEQTNT